MALKQWGYPRFPLSYLLLYLTLMNNYHRLRPEQSWLGAAISITWEILTLLERLILILHKNLKFWCLPRNNISSQQSI